MYGTPCKPSISRNINRSINQATRLNSTNNAFVRVNSSSDRLSSKSRLASNWGDIIIPSREEVLRHPARKIMPERNQAKTYKPDLSYLKKGPPTSLASRLANRMEEKPSEKWNNACSPVQVEAEARQRRVDELTAQRKAERLAREKSQSQKATASVAVRNNLTGRMHKATRQLGRQFEGTTAVLEQHNVEPKYDVQRERENISELQRTRNRMRGRGRSAQKSDAATPVSARRAIVRTKPTSSLLQTTQEDQGRDQSEDISLEILENGGDDKELPEFRSPDDPFANFDDLFRLSYTKRLNNAITHQISPLPKHTQWVRETFGGDYSRFTSQIQNDSLLLQPKADPLKHTQLILAKRGDVTISARNRVLGIVASSLSDSSSKEVRRL